MNFVIKQVSETGVISFYDGSEFVSDASDAKVISSVQDARYLQGIFQSQFINSEVSKVAATVSVSLG
jgi:hypothetical protein